MSWFSGLVRAGEGARSVRAAALAVVALAVAGVVWAASALQEQPFPHEKHEGLFPICTGCHVGIPTNDREAFFPQPDVCARCHDGVDVVEVSWTPPPERESNLRFTHDRHATLLDEAGDPQQSCETCHSPGASGRMSVQTEIGLDTCLSCHAHQAADHQVSAECVVCHVPLAESGFSSSAVAAITKPVDHDADDFIIEGHGLAAQTSTARCATCHTQEKCASCHVDTGREEIAAVPTAPADLVLPATVAQYPVPATHEADGWLSVHGPQASRDACATCHTSNDCQVCHVQPLPPVMSSIPSRDEAVAPGAQLTAHAPQSHESLFWVDAHPTAAASAGTSCATCHQQSFCTECHDGPSSGGYHPADFVARHRADAFGREAECATCHNTEVFCRGCHTEVGFTSFGDGAPAFHASESLWLLRHGQAARQSLESCASCHNQSDCTQCHGTLGAFKVNPHSQDFDAARAWAKNPQTCLICHTKNPLIGNTP